MNREEVITKAKDFMESKYSRCLLYDAMHLLHATYLTYRNSLLQFSLIFFGTDLVHARDDIRVGRPLDRRAASRQDDSDVAYSTHAVPPYHAFYDATAAPPYHAFYDANP